MPQRGLSVALLETGDLAPGHVSRSGKTLHGGLRYLEQRTSSWLREAAAERNLCVELLCPPPDPPDPPFLFPLQLEGWERLVSGGPECWSYDLIGGARSSECPGTATPGAAARTLALCPGALTPSRVKGGVQLPRRDLRRRPGTPFS